MFAIEITPNLAAAQFLPLRAQRRLDRLISRVTRRNRVLHAAIQDARRKARADQDAYDAWVCSQAQTLHNTSYDIDIPW